jgi:large subunit ribosomal protein L29
MNVKEIKELETAEIENKVRELKQDLCALRFQHATGQLENPNELKNIRRTIARMLTVLEERKAQ